MTFVRSVAPPLAVVAALYAATILLRGNENPGGGFIAGLALSAALALLGAACGAGRVRRAIRFGPAQIAATGALLVVAAGVPAWSGQLPYLSAIMFRFRLFGSDIVLSTVLAFEIGVCLATAGAVVGAALGLMEPDA